jgi:hypothetical protein
MTLISLLGFYMLKVAVKLVWQWQQATCVLSSRSKIILLWGLITGIQDNANADASARKGLNSLQSQTSNFSLTIWRQAQG